MNYKEADKFLKEPRNKASKKLQNHTYLVRRDENTIAALFHETDIITFHSNGSIVLNSGRWRTRATKDRINTYQDQVYLSQKNSIWYVGKGAWWEDGFNGKGIFQDGIKISARGKVTGGLPVSAEKKVLDLKKKINKYIDGYIKAFFNQEVPEPSEGDCWFCCMRTQEGVNMGDSTGPNNTHILEHFREKYYVPSLLVNAIKHTPVCKFTEGVLYYAWTEKNFSEIGEWYQKIASRDFRRSLRAYLYSRFEIAK